MKTEILKPNDDDIGERIDSYIAGCVDLTRSAIQKLIENNKIKVSGSSIQKNYRIKKDDVIIITHSELSNPEVIPEDLNINIVYEDSDLIIVDKNKGMVVHPATGNASGTLVNALLFHCGDSLSGINGVIRPGIVHRIDKDTSGLLVIAKNDHSHVELSRQIAEHSLERKYHAVVTGNIKEDMGIINKPIGRHKTDRKKMAVVSDGRESITNYKVLERFDNKFTYIEFQLQTGRTHQIRVHMSSVGHPILGDIVYGTNANKFEQQNNSLLQGQCLHAKSLGIIHPSTKEFMLFDSELPEYFQIILNKLRNMYGEV